jgi:hypothetical protein
MKTTKLIASMTLAAAALAAMAAPASAHHPEVQATAKCVDSAGTVTVTAEAWETDDADRRHNNDVRVLLDGNQVGAGKFTADNDYRFTVSTKAKAGTYTVRVVARAEWGKAENLGSAFEYREARVTVQPCPEYHPVIPTTTRVVMVETAPPTTMTAPVIGTPQVLERAPVVQAAAVEAPVVLAFTGPAMAARNALLAVGLMLAGYGLVRITRKS